jgi:G3E family GTPase
MSNPSNSHPKLPVTIITGFLGSGKTTLLNYILKNLETYKVAVLVNEFGDINIDSQFLIVLEKDMIELTNGCICCTINDNLADAVYRVLERQDQIDYLIVETTGIADPLAIALTLLGTDLLQRTAVCRVRQTLWTAVRADASRGRWTS